MNVVQVKLELERLVPAKVSWVVEEIEKNMFKTIFLSKGEMLQMIEWGELQTKDRKAKLVIEELRGGSSINTSDEAGLGVDGKIAKRVKRLSYHLGHWHYSRGH
jgi:hypothetical protein